MILYTLAVKVSMGRLFTNYHNYAPPVFLCSLEILEEKKTTLLTAIAECNFKVVFTV